MGMGMHSFFQLGMKNGNAWGVVKTYTAHNLYTQPPQLIPTDISLHNLYQNWRQGAKTYTIFEINKYQFFSIS